jgi:hypothetical protein
VLVRFHEVQYFRPRFASVKQVYVLEIERHSPNYEGTVKMASTRITNWLYNRRFDSYAIPD